MTQLIVHPVMVIPVIGEVRHTNIRMHPNARYETLKKLVEPFLNGDKMDHRAVLYNGERRDLFVGQVANSRRDWDIRNIRASEILNAHVRLLHPDAHDIHLPAVNGTAVLFPDSRIWF